jgi:hypothetical protein
MWGLLALFMLITMTSTHLPDGLFAVAGLCGVGTTILTIIGLGFCIAGPAKAKGMAIATVSVAGVHVILVIICYDKLTGGRGGGGFGGGFIGGIDWIFLGTSLWVLDVFLPALIYAPKGAGIGGETILFLFAGLCELARMIMVCLTLQRLAYAAKDDYSAEKAGSSVMVTSIVTGAGAIIILLVVVIIDAAKMGRSAMYLGGLALTALCVGYALMALTAAFVAMSTKDSLARRARRG